MNHIAEDLRNNVLDNIDFMWKGLEEEVLDLELGTPFKQTLEADFSYMKGRVKRLSQQIEKKGKI